MFLVVAVTVAFAAEGKDAAIQPIVNLRDSGYLLGDLVDEHVELALPAGFRLDVDSLPLPGRVAPWLELRSARIDDGQQERDRVNITVTYQVFAEVEQASRVPIPRFTLRLRGATPARTRPRWCRWSSRHPPPECCVPSPFPASRRQTRRARWPAAGAA